MLILRPVKGIWYVISSDFPGGAWFGFNDEDVARRVIQWMTLLDIDFDGILTRLYQGELTERDKNTVKSLNKATRHPSRVRSNLPTEYQRVYRERQRLKDQLHGNL